MTVQSAVFVTKMNLVLLLANILTLTHGCCIGAFQDQNPQPVENQGAWNGSLLDNVNNDFRLRGISLFLRTYCGQAAQRALNNRTANMTVFLPSDQALRKVLDLNLTLGAAAFNCSTSGANASAIAQGCDPNTWPMQFQNVTVQEISPCSPLLMQYAIIPDQVLNLTASNSTSQSASGNSMRSFLGFQQGGSNGTNQFPNNTANITVFNTTLNDPRFVNLANNASQVVILNQTKSGEYYLNHGYWPPARVQVNQTIRGVNGIIYLVDNLLLPPMNVSRTLEGANLTQFMSALNQSGNNLLANLTQMQNVTIFAPLNSVLQANSSNFNPQSYIFPNYTHYMNERQGVPENITALDGSVHQILHPGNYSMIVDGAQSVQNNVLMSNGVIHIIDSLFQTNSSSSGGVGVGAGSGMPYLTSLTNTIGGSLPTGNVFKKKKNT